MINHPFENELYQLFMVKLGKMFISLPTWYHHFNHHLLTSNPPHFCLMNIIVLPTTIIVWLVVWNMTFIFPYIGNFIIPTHELIFFRGVGIPPTRIDLDEFDQDQEPCFPSNDGNWIRGIIPQWLITAPKIPKIPGSSNSWIDKKQLQQNCLVGAYKFHIGIYWE